MPVQADGAPASSVDRRTWAPYGRMRAASIKGRLGFVLGAGIGCIDLDHCLADGVVAPWAQAVLDATPDTYVEVSPSGDGLHVWGLLPERPGRVVRDGRCIEAYSVGRYMTVTGKRWGSSPLRLVDLSVVAAGL